ncbi:hypothetical protein ETB97_008744 [Aspergillus alliaceus]|uniref:Cupin type-1 domain-containing protein n=1 Tax=Petromyces alliaceus TaxID=209559 RepID=A0A8H6AHJ5_PETAA|nr:hypothetical protein ETB97_008744 [Aspergillus burnettii]
MLPKSALCLVVAVMLALVLPASAAPQPITMRATSELSLTAQLRLADTAIERYQLLPQDEDFVFNFTASELPIATSQNFPALVGTSASFSISQLPGCSMSFLHLHPRATELFAITSGRVLSEMVPEAGVLDSEGKQRVIRAELSPGMLTIYPAGSFHTQVNPDCEPAHFAAAFTSDEFAVGLVAQQTFSLSDDVIAATFGQSIGGEDIETVRDAIPKTMAIQVEECLNKCASTVLSDRQQQQQQNPPPGTATSGRISESLNVESNEEGELNYPTGTKFWFTIIALCMILILGGLDANIVATAVPSITNHFHTVADVGWINLPIGVVSLATMLLLFSDPRTRQEDDLTLTQKIIELDLVSNCLFIPSLTALFVALSWAGTKYPWSDGKVIGLFVVFAVLLAVFILNQHRRGDSAALPFRILKSRSVIAGFIFTTCTNSMTNVLEWYLPTYYQVVRSRSPSESGYLMIPILVGMMLGLFLQGIGTTTFGYYAPFMIFASICMPIAAGLMTTYNLHTSLVQIILYSGFAGFSGGIGFQGSQAAVQTTLSAADVNLGIGVILFGQSMGPAVFIAIAQVIFTNRLSSALQDIVPGLTPGYIAEHGLGDLKNGVPIQEWDRVLCGIERSLTHTWYLAVALACTTIVGSLMIEWRSVKQKQS